MVSTYFQYNAPRAAGRRSACDRAMSPMPPRDEQEVMDSIEDIEQVFKIGRLSEIIAVLQEPELKDLWRIPDGQRALAILQDRIDLRRRAEGVSSVSGLGLR